MKILKSSPFSYPMQKSPEYRKGVFAIILFYNVAEAHQRHFLSAAPHSRTMDERIWGKGGQEETRISKYEPHDWIGRDARVRLNECANFL